VYGYIVTWLGFTSTYTAMGELAGMFPVVRDNLTIQLESLFYNHFCRPADNTIGQVFLRPSHQKGSLAMSLVCGFT
jgi:hypothetical protein